MSTIERILRKNTMGLFNDSWYYKVTNELLNIKKEVIGYVYFIRNDKGSLVKIGKTHNLSKRISSLKSGMGKGLYLQGYIYTDNYHSIELELHKKFKKERSQGEWFDIDLFDIDILIKEYNGVITNGFYSNKSNIIDGEYFNIDKLKGITNLPYWDLFFNMLENDVNKNERIGKSIIYEKCIALHNKYTSVTKKKVAMITKQWCDYKGYVYRSENSNGVRYFIISA